VEFQAGFFMTVTEELRQHDPQAEHTVIMNDLSFMVAAEKAGFKYAVVPEHHFLDEYSHIAGNVPALGWLAAKTERMHLLSGIMNPLPQIVHPAKVAETVAMLDHLTGGRYEFGTGRGAGSYEILGFLPEGAKISDTKDIWADVIGEFPKMWLQDTYEGYHSKYWKLPPRKIIPKMYKPAHPPMWYAAGNASSYEMAGRMGLGIIGNAITTFDTAESAVASYRKGIAQAEPVGAFVNDYITAVFQPFVSEDEDRVFEWAMSDLAALNVSLIYRYHDTFPRPDFVPQWPQIKPRATREEVLAMQEAGQLFGTPERIIDTIRRYEAIGVDGICVGVGQYGSEQAMETIEFFGKHIIPEFDTDPEFRTDRFRYASELVS
jgi:alkanesulfonate monooxygenase SsuD/methylene tetrahydromethanopterin reductase-like flavin-dependent oxidoreductase (luciferase family)